MKFASSTFLQLTFPQTNPAVLYYADYKSHLFTFTAGHVTYTEATCMQRLLYFFIIQKLLLSILNHFKEQFAN